MKCQESVIWKRRFTEDQVAFALREAAPGISVEEVCSKIGISDTNIYVWRKRYSGVGSSELYLLSQKAFDGALNADSRIDFLGRLVKAAARKVYLILDNLRVQQSKPVKAWLTEHKARSKCSEPFRYVVGVNFLVPTQQSADSSGTFGDIGNDYC